MVLMYCRSSFHNQLQIAEIKVTKVILCMKMANMTAAE